MTVSYYGHPIFDNIKIKVFLEKGCLQNPQLMTLKTQIQANIYSAGDYDRF